jgi:TPR repeat protein
MQSHYAKLLRATLTASLFLVAVAGAAVAGPFEDAVTAYVKGDYATALRLLRPLADQGDARAQYTLGFLYRTGQGVPQDYVQAHMWSNLAAGYQNAVNNRDAVARLMTPAQIAEAQKLAREWKPKPER